MKNVGIVLDTYCKSCGVFLNTTRKNKVFCSEKCCGDYWHLYGKNKHQSNKICVVCGKEYTPNPKSHISKTCSQECYKINKRNVQNKRQAIVRKEFRERFNLTTGNGSINSEFIYNQELLIENKLLLESLQLMDKIRKERGKKICAICGKQYHSSRKNQGKTCSPECLKQFRSVIAINREKIKKQNKTK